MKSSSQVFFTKYFKK